MLGFTTKREETFIEGKKRFKMCYVDADTILHQSSVMLQQKYIIVKHKSGKWKDRFENISSFWGLGNTIGGFLKEINDKKEKSGTPLATKDDFIIEEFFELKPEFSNSEKALSAGLSAIGSSVGKIKKFTDSEDYRLIISGGKGNYRNEYGKTLKYKGNRSDKPILYTELKEAMLDMYKTKVILADFCEAEDICGWEAKKEEIIVGEDFKDWSIAISYIDKDVDHVYAPSTNYSKFEEGYRLPTKIECTKALVTQIICGDTACDNIQGLPKLTEEVTKKFGLRKSNGCGKASAQNLLDSCKTEKDMFERAVFAYQSYYGMDTVEFEAWDGEKLTWTWLDFMKETAILVKMQEFEGQRYDVEDTLKELGINYQERLFQPIIPDFLPELLLREVVNSLRSEVRDLAELATPKKAEAKPLQITKLENVVERLNKLEKQFNNLFAIEDN